MATSDFMFLPPCMFMVIKLLHGMADCLHASEEPELIVARV
ncbi:hypothetical protein AAFM46_09490 [Arthrobacter sp. TMP15]